MSISYIIYIRFEMININNLPVEYKDRLDKSSLILSLISSNTNKFNPKVFSDFGIVTILNSENYKIIDIYASNDDFRIDVINSKKYHRFEIIALSDAVIDENGHIFKNRWGVNDDSHEFTKMMDTMKYNEIKEYYKTDNYGKNIFDVRN